MRSLILSIVRSMFIHQIKSNYFSSNHSFVPSLVHLWFSWVHRFFYLFLHSSIQSVSQSGSDSINEHFNQSFIHHATVQAVTQSLSHSVIHSVRSIDTFFLFRSFIHSFQSCICLLICLILVIPFCPFCSHSNPSFILCNPFFPVTVLLCISFMSSILFAAFIPFLSCPFHPNAFHSIPFPPSQLVIYPSIQSVFPLVHSSPSSHSSHPVGHSIIHSFVCSTCAHASSRSVIQSISHSVIQWTSHSSHSIIQPCIHSGLQSFPCFFFLPSFLLSLLPSFLPAYIHRLSYVHSFFFVHFILPFLSVSFLYLLSLLFPSKLYLPYLP